MHSLHRDDSRALYLWAWTYDPSDIPKVTWLTLTDGSTTLLDDHAPPSDRKGLTFRVLVHLDIIEPPPDEYGKVTPRKMDWRYEVVDGKRNTRDRHDPPPPDSRRDRLRDDDDDDRGRGRRGDNGGWKFRMFRNLSCPRPWTGSVTSLYRTTTSKRTMCHRRGGVTDLLLPPPPQCARRAP